MIDSKFLPLLLMDSSYLLIDSLLTNENKPEYLNSPSLRYYIEPYKKQRRKYFKKSFEGAPDELYDALDGFEDNVKPFILCFYNVILEIIQKEFDDINDSDKQVLATFHCNAVLLKCAKNYHKKINIKPCSQISDLIEYNSQILKKLPIISKHSIDLNTYETIQNSLKILVNQFFQFFKK